MTRQYRRLKFDFTDNDSDTLIIAFQSAGRIHTDDYPKILDGTLADAEVRAMHDNLNWKKLEASYPKANFLFPKDYFSRSYGWYVCDNGHFFHDQLNHELSDFIERGNYRRVVAFGSSKGGTASLLYGMMNPHITDVFALVPQIQVARYLKKYMPDLMPLITGTEDAAGVTLALNNLLSSETIRKNVRETNFWTYTGIKDDQYQQIIEFHREWPDSTKHNLIINTREDRHTPLVVQHQTFIFSILRALAEGRPVLHPQLSKVQEGLHLYS